MKTRKAQPPPNQNSGSNFKEKPSQKENNVRIDGKHVKILSLLFNGLKNKNKENAFIKIRNYGKAKQENQKYCCQKLFSFYFHRLIILKLKKQVLRSSFNRNLVLHLRRIQKRVENNLKKEFFSRVKIRNNLKTRGKEIISSDGKFENKLTRKPNQLTILEQNHPKTIDERKKVKSKIEEQEVNKLLQEVDDSLKRKDERKLVVCLRKIVTQYSKAQCLAKGFYIFRAFKELLGYENYNQRQTGDFQKLINIMLSDSKHLDYYLKQLRQRKKTLKKERKKDGNEEDPIKMQKIEKDLRNLQQLFNLIIEHYEGGYEHKRRTRKNLKSSKSRNQSMYTRTDGFTIIGESSFVEESFVDKKSLTPGKHNKSNLLKNKEKLPGKHYHIVPSSEYPQYQKESYKFSPQGSGKKNQQEKMKSEENNQFFSQEAIKYQNLYQESKKMLQQYKETMKGIQHLTLELKGLNYKISFQKNYSKNLQKLTNLNLKQEIGIKDEIVKLYESLKKEAEGKISSKEKQIDKIQTKYQNEKDKAEASHSRFLEENKKLKALQAQQKQTKNQKHSETSQLKEENKVLFIEKNKFQRLYENSRSQMKNLQQKLKNTVKIEAQNRQLQIQINKLIKSKQHLEGLINQSKFRSSQNKEAIKKLEKLTMENKQLEDEFDKVRTANMKNKEQLQTAIQQIKKYQSLGLPSNKRFEKPEKQENKMISQMQQLQNTFINIVQRHKDQQIYSLNQKVLDLKEKQINFSLQQNQYEKQRISLIKQNQNLKIQLRKQDNNTKQSQLEQRLLKLQSKIKPAVKTQKNQVEGKESKNEAIILHADGTSKQERYLISPNQSNMNNNRQNLTFDIQNNANPEFYPNLSFKTIQTNKILTQVNNDNEQSQDFQKRISQIEKHIKLLEQQSQKYAQRQHNITQQDICYAICQAQLCQHMPHNAETCSQFVQVYAVNVAYAQHTTQLCSAYAALCQHIGHKI